MIILEFVSYFQFDQFYGSLNESMQNAATLITNALDKINKKEHFDAYQSFGEFLTDVEWIVNEYTKLFKGLKMIEFYECSFRTIFDFYNLLISFFICSFNSVHISDNRTKVKLANKLKRTIDEEMKDLKHCADCYSNANQFPSTWLRMVCDEPHIIVWAKFESEYWPAKLLSIDGSKLYVKYFYKSRYACKVLASECILYSEEYPVKRAKLPHLVNEAIKVILTKHE